MRRLIFRCAASLALYVIMFGFILNRPLSLGILQLEMQQKTARLNKLPSPKLVILAGSNGPYSHSCVVIGAMLNLPCENAGIAVGIGLDEIFARDAPALHKGDILYMPMELQQYAITRLQNDSGADAAILLRHDRDLLRRLPPGRILGAVFCCNVKDFLESVLEMPIASRGLFRPDARLDQEYNLAGDRINTPPAGAEKSLLTMPARPPPSFDALQRGYGAALIGEFVKAETARGVVVIGGLPTDFADVEIPRRSVAAIAAIYTGNGGFFVALPNQSRYPRTAFYDSEDHLSQPWQHTHSVAVAQTLQRILSSK